MKIYYAGPLFCQAELEFNEKVAAMLREKGYEVFLPQEGPDIRGLMSDPSTDKRKVMRGFFADDLRQIDSSDAFLFIMDGRVPDEGACFELGYAYAKGKPCFALKTDVRESEYGTDNAMLVGSLDGRMYADIPSLLFAISTMNRKT